jgi:hypothetical protein
MIKKILCVGVFGHENTYILAALIKKIIRENNIDNKFFINCAGIKEESVRQYQPCKSFYSTINQLGFFPSREATHPTIQRDADRKNLIPLNWDPTFIGEIGEIDCCDIFITPYKSVFKELKAKRYTREKKLLLACEPTGISLDCCPANAAEKMMPWVKNYFGK